LPNVVTMCTMADANQFFEEAFSLIDPAFWRSLVIVSRVTRLGQFWRWFTLGTFGIITKVAQFLRQLFSHGKSYVCINFDIKRGCATFWAFFSQTHLVALIVSRLTGLIDRVSFKL
jgi:hypothetical protein